MGKKIESLTPEQEARVPEFVDKWRKIGLCTEPADWNRAEKGIKQIYKDAGLKSPKIIRVTSQHTMAIVRSIFMLLDQDSQCNKFFEALSMNLKKNSFSGSINLDDINIENEIVNIFASSKLPKIGKHTPDSSIKEVMKLIYPSMKSVLKFRNKLESLMDKTADGDLVLFAKSLHLTILDLIKSNSKGIEDGFRSAIGDAAYGQHDASWLAFYDYFKVVCGLEEETKKLKGLWEVAQSAGWYLPHEEICWVADRHQIVEVDEQFRLHNENGPSLAYSDGVKVYAVHGVHIPEYVIERPEEITCNDIEQEANAEVRRIKLDRFGWARYLEESGCKETQRDKCGILFRKEIPNDEALVMVKLKNSSPEPDGSFKDYFLRVPPEIQTAKAGVAWSFGFSENDYAPELET